MVATCITVHCTATKNGAYLDPEKINEWHKARGFKKAGYHYLTQPSGRIDSGHPLRELNELGAHVKGANKSHGGINVGIALAGTDKYTRIQLLTLNELVTDLARRFNIPLQYVYCHREFPSAREQGKTCPNIRPVDLIVWLMDARSQSIEKYVLRQEDV